MSQKDKSKRVLYDPNRRQTISNELALYLKTEEAKREYTFFDKTPLPMVKSEIEFLERISIYEGGREDRNIMYFHRTEESWYMARKMYYTAIRGLYFMTEGVEKVREVVKWYNPREHVHHMKRLVICLRKIAKCCFELQLYQESLGCCEMILKLVEEHDVPKRYLYLTYGIMGQVLSVNDRTAIFALKYIEAGLTIKQSPTLINQRKNILERIPEEDLKKINVENIELRARFEFLTNTLPQTDLFSKENMPILEIKDCWKFKASVWKSLLV